VRFSFCYPAHVQLLDLNRAGVKHTTIPNIVCSSLALRLLNTSFKFLQLGTREHLSHDHKAT